MGTTSVYALPYPASSDAANVPLDMQELADRLVLVLGGALSATPPASPFEGQLWALQAGTGVVWMFRYNASSASAYKWEFIGGPPLFAHVVTEEFQNTGAYADPTTAGPTVTVPREGDYLTAFGARIYCGTAARTLSMAIKRGAAATVDADGVDFYVQTANVPYTLVREFSMTALAASTALKVQYKGQGTDSNNFAKRWLRVFPTRIS